MDEKILGKILERLDSLEERMNSFEKFKSQTSQKIKTEKTVHLTPKEHLTEDLEKVDDDINSSASFEKRFRSEETGGYFLGYIGAACVLLAAILLIRLSINSGWLTPLRQCLLATGFGFSLLTSPYWVRKSQDKSYFSLLPALGLTILHLTIYGAVFYHQLLSFKLGLVFISLVGFLSLAFLVWLKEEIYALFAIIGTYSGALFFYQSFAQISSVAFYLILWDIVFALFAVVLRKRDMILIPAYIAIGLVCLYGLEKYPTKDLILFKNIIWTQAAQFLVFILTTIYYSIKHKEALSFEKTMLFLPLLVFFYGQEYFFIDVISSNYATAFSLGIVFVLLSLYHYAEKKMNGLLLESNSLIYTVSALILAHSIFFVRFDDFQRVIASFVIALISLSFYGQLKDNKRWQGVLVVFAFLFMYSFFLVVFGSNKISFNTLILFSAFFTALCVLGAKKFQKTSFLLLLAAHSQAFITFYRLKKHLGTFAFTPLLVAYSLGFLFWGMKKKNKEILNSSLLIIFAGLLNYIVFDHFILNPLESLIASALFAGFFLYSSTLKRGEESDIILYFAHAMVFHAIFLCHHFIGYFLVAPLWIAYAFAILYWAYTTKEKMKAHGAIPLVILGLGRFIVHDFSVLTNLQQIISLFVMGGIIFAGGYLYRKTILD